MDCPACQRSNAADAAFCASCGTALSSTCVACSAPLSPGDAFCSRCGSPAPSGSGDGLTRYVPPELLTKLQAARAGKAMAGERRTVTMLFADIQGSTAAAERLDPEEWAEIANGAFERLIQPVYRYEGTLARLMGDAVLAFFGAPIAHEDDPERAVRAGLDMLDAVRPYARSIEDEWDVTVDLRVGINTGLVVVGEVGSDLRVEYTALGDAVNVAARMEQTAAAGTLQISAATHRHVASLFDFEELEPVAAKGKSEPVPAFRVTGIRARPATTRGLLGGDTPLVGRDTELARLRAVVDGLSGGTGQVCAIVGEAGVGKSRLTASLKAVLEADGRLAAGQTDAAGSGVVRWAEARCMSYNSAMPYAPIIDLFSRMFEIAPGLDDGAARTLVADAVQRAVPANPSIVTGGLCTLLGIALEPHEAAVIEEMPPPVLQKRIFSSVAGYLEASARSIPTVIVFEDLHWADPVSLALLDDLVAVMDRTPLAVITLTRSTRDDPVAAFLDTVDDHWPDHDTAIRLNRLDNTTAANMVTRLLGGGELPDSLQAMILSRADGNPFFIEEIVRELMESGTVVRAGGTWSAAGEVDRVTIPAGVAGLLTARIDRLDEAARLAVQLASVIGREFAADELEHIAGESAATHQTLADLVSRDMIEPSRQQPGSYVFRHALVQEAAYETILLKSRRRLHAGVAEMLIGREGDAQETARHLLASRQERRAVPYLVAAAERAARAMSLADAVRLYQEAVSWLEDDADVELVQRVHEGLGTTYTLVPDLSRALASYQAMLDLGLERDAPSVQITALNRLGFTTAFLGGDYDEATMHLEQARLLAEQAGDEAGLAQYHRNSCMVATARGDLRQAATHDDATARLGSSLGSQRLELGGLLQRTLSLAMDTRYDEAAIALERAREAVAEVTDPAVLATMAEAEGFFLIRDGHLGDAWRLTRDAAVEAERAGSSVASVLAFVAGIAAAMSGDHENALASHAAAVRLGEETGQLYYAAASAASMARIYAELGIGDQRVAELQAASGQYLQGPLGRTLESTVLAELGWAAYEMGDRQEAAARFEAGVAGGSAAKMMETPSLLFGLALVEAANGDVDRAAAHLSEGSAFIAERAMVQFRPLEAMARGGLLRAQELPAEAAAVYAAGAEAAAAIGAAEIGWRLHAAGAGALALAGETEAAAVMAAHARELVAAHADRIVDATIRETYVRTATDRLADHVGAF
jgi:predicted ATPase/class 3 adenylate cyclase